MYIHVGYPMILITSFGCIINYLKQCYYSVYIYEKTVNNNDESKSKKTSLLHRICELYTQSRLLNFLLTFVILQLLYSLVVSYVSDNYSLVYIKKGFCCFSVEYLPQIVLVCIFLFVSFPLIVYQFYRLHENFKFVNTLMINLLIMTISAALFIWALVVPSYNCSLIVRYLPSDAYALILINLYYMNKKANKLELNKNGLIKVLNDEFLFNEFFEFCKRKCCVENAIFHIEYKKFKELNNLYMKKSKWDLTFGEHCILKISKSKSKISSPDSVLNDSSNIDKITKSSNYDSDEFKNSKDSNWTSDLDFSNFKDGKKKIILYSEIHTLANDIYTNFIDENAKYGLNIPDKIAKDIKNDLLIHNQRFNSNTNTQLNEENDIEEIFDYIYDEILQDLYLNAYTDFILNRNKNKEKNHRKKNKNKNINYDFDN
ncbi:hypothetical protein BCR32DRAFT_267318 [Anaeromyces robustus]|uniref:RGS domain-containing protein n=1 Tax=Anaeromyces robustus TaxID=1754192 RepID=A0A1Y1XB34_9FUNG|nr:hypothetical protein BCR32DRAFT_267318 [Anaeromyces robustus]|eukprot:ORX82933.1 hypothetical protein BCR32DRAFT_267318 [Anaeromyces robustus]